MDDLAALVATALRTAGITSIGYKCQWSGKSMHSQTLPGDLVQALKRKLDLGALWKSLSSSGTASPGAVAAAESAYDDQASLVDGLFESLHSFRRARKWGPGRFRGKSRCAVSQYPNQTVKSQHISINILGSANRLEFSLTR